MSSDSTANGHEFDGLKKSLLPNDKSKSIVLKIIDSFRKQDREVLTGNNTVASRRSSRLPTSHSPDEDLQDVVVVKDDEKQSHASEKKSQDLLSGFAYCVSSCSMILLNKAVLSSYNFDAGISLMFYQVLLLLLYRGVSVAKASAFGYLVIGVPGTNLICVIIVMLLRLFRVVTTEKITWRLIKIWIPVNLIFIGMLVTGMYSLKHINIAMVTILKNVTNILTAVGETYMFKKRHNRKVWIALFLMIVSAASGGITDLSFNFTGYAWQSMNCILTASYSLTLRRVMDVAKQSTQSGSLNEISMVLLNNALSLPFALFLIILFDEWEYVYNLDVIRVPMFWVVATSSGVLGLAISFTSMWFLNQTGPTTYSLVGSLNKIPISIIGVLVFRSPLSVPNLFSVLFGLFAGVFFAKAKMS